MNSVGIDLHRKRSHIAALDEAGMQLLSRRIVNDPQTFLALLEGLGECRIALEATYGWEWLADVLQDAGYELNLAHPMRTKAIASARVKTDAVDARTLAHLLRADLLPEAYIAPRELRDLRDLLCRRVGRYIAMLVIAEVGDITRFPNARRLCSWAGLTPTVRSSDGKARLGHISSQGSPALRWALVEAAQHAGSGGGPLHDTYERIAKRRGKQIAKVAIARQILTLCYYGLRDAEIRCLAPRATTRASRPPAVSA